jgi:nitroreductase
MEAQDVLTTTRAVRRRLDLSRPVDPEVIRACLTVALQAPTGGGRQHWRWVVVTDARLRGAIAEIYQAAFAARYGSPEEQAADSPTLASARFLAANLARVPVLVIPCLELSGAGLPPGNQAGVWGSLLPAAWSYMLAARDRGLGTAWTTVALDREQEVADVLALPASVRQGALIPTAHTTGPGFRPAARIPLESVLHVNGWHAGRDGDVRD